MSSINTEFPLPLRLAEAIANPLFPRIDTALRSGRHISADEFEQHSALVEYHQELEIFYGRYQVELIKAPEGFFYLRPRPSVSSREKERRGSTSASHCSRVLVSSAALRAVSSSAARCSSRMESLMESTWR